MKKRSDLPDDLNINYFNRTEFVRPAHRPKSSHPPIGRSVGRSVDRSVGRSVDWLVGWRVDGSTCKHVGW